MSDSSGYDDQCEEIEDKEIDESKVVYVDDDENEAEGSDEYSNEDDDNDSIGLMSPKSDVQVLSWSNETIFISSDDDNVTPFGPQRGKNELEVDGGKNVDASSRTRSKMSTVKDLSDQLLISSDTDTDTDVDDIDDEDFDLEVDNYGGCIEELSSLSEEYEEEDYDIYTDEGDDEESEGSDSVKEMSDTPASKKRAFLGTKNAIKLDFSGNKSNSKKNGNHLDGVREETEDRISNFEGDERDEQVLGGEKGSWRVEKSPKQANASEGSDVRCIFKTYQRRRNSGQKQHCSLTSAREDCDAGQIFKTYQQRGESGQKQHCSLASAPEDFNAGQRVFKTYVRRGRDKESSENLEKNGKGNDKLKCDGADEERLGEEKGDCKEGESRKSTNTKQTNNDVRIPKNGNSSVDGVGKRVKRFTYSTKRKRVCGGDDDFCRILADSILEDREAREGKAEEQVIKQVSSVEHTLPLKFKFEEEEPKPVEKTDFETMVDNLFDELNFSLISEQMGSSHPAEEDDETNVPEGETNQTTLCRVGKHYVVLDEQIGYKCLHCSYVQLESKYVLPPWLQRKSTSKASWRENYIGGEELSENVDIAASKENPRGCLSRTKGTIWDVIPGIRESMYLHQQEGFEFLWKNLAGTINLAELKSFSNTSEVGGCIISHAPGTGKTRLTITFINAYLKSFPNCRPVIIAPASMLLTWEEEFRKWKVEFPFHNLNNPEFSGQENETALGFLRESKRQNKDEVRMVKMYSWSKDRSILGISYSLYDKLAGEKFEEGKGKKQNKAVAEKWRKMLLELPDLVVLDEGHTPRNERSCIWNTLLKLQTKRRIILSGTPFQNNFGELFNTLRLVRSTVAGRLAKEKTFAHMISSKGGKYNRKQSREERAVLRREVVDEAIKRLKATIAPFVHVHKGSILQESLPGLRDCMVLLNPPPLQKHLINQTEGSQSTLEYEHKVALVSVHPSLLLHCSLSDKEKSIIEHQKLEQLRLHADKGAKTRFVMELIRLSIALNEKVLIFSQYIQPLELVKDQLKEVFDWDEGREVLKMEGKLDQKHRQNMINIFNSPNSDAKVLLASITCCSEGISLVGASRVVLLDVVWNPSVERQAISRAYRLGQNKVVHTYHLMTSGTTEGEKYCRQAEKDRLSELVFSCTGNEKENEKGKQKRSSAAVFDDKILDELIGHEKLKDMFEKIVYQPKETNLIENFGLVTSG